MLPLCKKAPCGFREGVYAIQLRQRFGSFYLAVYISRTPLLSISRLGGLEDAKILPMEGCLLKDIARHSYQLKLTIRITRIWEHWNMDSTVLYCLNFFMADRKGGTMERTIPTNRMRIFKNKFHEGVIYTIEHFEILRAREKFSVVKHSFRISFAQKIVI